jgi:hypothetical protein
MSGENSVANRASFGMLGYIFVGMTAIVMVMAVAVVFADVAGRSPYRPPLADVSAAQR